ncbi:MAG TPA: GNAT family protein [Ktedonobacterales bacterium]|jgi:RimJ/RimL family protein N-acetyltransferase|nr:GNAT family protein [Ktedonobacterales bacterium]
MSGDVVLRDVTKDDFPIFFEQQLDPDANWMAAFTARNPSDREAFMAHWAETLADGTIGKQTILFGGRVAGNVVSFEQSGEREVGYWIGKEYWGKGIATQALAAFLRLERTRPLYGYVAEDNIGSQRVLEKCGFTRYGEAREFSHTRGKEVEALILMLHAENGHDVR